MESFENWLTSSQLQRDALFLHSKSKIPTDRGELSDDIEKSIRAAEAAGAQLAKSQYYLTEATAQALITARDLSPDIKGKERDIMIKDSVKGVQLLNDEIENLARSINNRVRAMLNSRRSLL